MWKAYFIEKLVHDHEKFDDGIFVAMCKCALTDFCKSHPN